MRTSRRSSSVLSTPDGLTPRSSWISGRGDRLAVGDDRQRLERRHRQLGCRRRPRRTCAASGGTRAASPGARRRPPPRPARRGPPPADVARAAPPRAPPLASSRSSSSNSRAAAPRHRLGGRRTGSPRAPLRSPPRCGHSSESPPGPRPPARAWCGRAGSSPVSVWWMRTRSKPRQLEHGEEGGDRLGAAGARAQVVEQVEGPAGVERAEQPVELAAHRDSSRRAELDRRRMLAVVAVEDLAEGARAGRRARPRPVDPRSSSSGRPPGAAAARVQMPCRSAVDLGQRLRRLLEAPVLEQALRPAPRADPPRARPRPRRGRGSSIFDLRWISSAAS